MGESQADAEKELRSRPSYEQGARDYKAMLMEMRGVFADLVPEVKWTRDDPYEKDNSFCEQPYTDIQNAAHGFFDAGTAKGKASGAVWPEMKGKLVAIAAQYGFTDVSMLKDTSEGRVLTIKNASGGYVELMDGDYTTLSVSGSCMIRETPRPTVVVTPSETGS